MVNRVRLCGHYARRGLRGEVHVYGAVMRRWVEGGDRYLFACSLEFHCTLKIIVRTISEVVNRERLCGTNALISVASAIFGAVRLLGHNQSQSVTFGHPFEM